VGAQSSQKLPLDTVMIASRTDSEPAFGLPRDAKVSLYRLRRPFNFCRGVANMELSLAADRLPDGPYDLQCGRRGLPRDAASIVESQ
jgi:hypothetical protein